MLGTGYETGDIWFNNFTHKVYGREECHLQQLQLHPLKYDKRAKTRDKNFEKESAGRRKFFSYLFLALAFHCIRSQVVGWFEFVKILGSFGLAVRACRAFMRVQYGGEHPFNR